MPEELHITVPYLLSFVMGTSFAAVESKSLNICGEIRQAIANVAVLCALPPLTLSL